MAINEGQTRRIVGGVDTHKDLHVAAVVDEQDRVLGTRSFATKAARSPPRPSDSLAVMRDDERDAG